MKRFSVFVPVVLILIVSGNAFAQKQKCELLPLLYSGSETFERNGDVLITRGGTFISVEAKKLLVDKRALADCEILELGFLFDNYVAGDDRIRIEFESISNKFIYDVEADRKIALLADGKEIFSAVLKQQERDDLSKNIKREHLGLNDDIHLPLVRALAEAKSLTVRFGKRTFPLTSIQRQAIVDFYSEVKKLVKNDSAVK